MRRKRDTSADPAVIDLAQQREQRRKPQPSGDGDKQAGEKQDAQRGQKQVDARGRRVRADEVDEASDDSFPASDPPSFTGGR